MRGGEQEDSSAATSLVEVERDRFEAEQCDVRWTMGDGRLRLGLRRRTGQLAGCLAD